MAFSTFYRSQCILFMSHAYWGLHNSSIKPFIVIAHEKSNILYLKYRNWQFRRIYAFWWELFKVKCVISNPSSSLVRLFAQFLLFSCMQRSRLNSGSRCRSWSHAARNPDQNQPFFHETVQHIMDGSVLKSLLNLPFSPPAAFTFTCAQLVHYMTNRSSSMKPSLLSVESNHDPHQWGVLYLCTNPSPPSPRAPTHSLPASLHEYLLCWRSEAAALPLSLSPLICAYRAVFWGENSLQRTQIQTSG